MAKATKPKRVGLPGYREKLALCTKHFRTPKGERFDVTPEGRRWVVDDLFIPADGYRVCAVDPEHLCEACKAKAGKIVDRWVWPIQDAFELHRNSKTARDAGCLGLDLRPILVILVSAPRREGKSFNIDSYCFATMCTMKRRSMCMIAASDAQVRRIVSENIVGMVDQSPYLAARVRIKRSEGKIEVPSTGSFLRVWSASASSIAGSSYSHVLIEEAATTDPRPFVKLAFSMGDAVRMECARGCAGLATVPVSERGKARCPTCGDRLVPFYPRLFIFSSADELTGDEYDDWFDGLLNSLLEYPHAQTKVYHTQESKNPAVDTQMVGTIFDILSRVEALKRLAAIEVGNAASSLSGGSLPEDRVLACMDPSWTASLGDERPTVGFLDTSVVGDLTTLLFLTDNRRPSRELELERSPPPFLAYSVLPWDAWRVTHLQVWDPKEQPGGVIDEHVIESYFREIARGFPRLILLMVDTRHPKGLAGERGRGPAPWAKGFALRLQRDPYFANIVKMMHRQRDETGERIGEHLADLSWGEEDRKTSWSLFLWAIINRRIWLPGGRSPFAARILKEVRGIIRDENGNIRDKSRKKVHAEILETVAGACLLANRERWLEMERARPSIYSDEMFPKLQAALQKAFQSPIRGLRGMT